MLTLPMLAIHHPNLLMAHTYAFAHTAGLIVYRSPLVKEGDDIFQPVADMLREHRMEMIVQETLPDVDMAFGRAELEVYRNGDSDQDAPLMPIAEKLMRGLIKRGGFQ